MGLVVIAVFGFEVFAFWADRGECFAPFSDNRQNLEKSTETLTDGATHPRGTILRTNSLTLSRSDTP